MPKIKLTISKIEKEIPFTRKGQKLYWDTELPGFGLCVGRTKKSFVVQTKVNGKSVRHTIGTCKRWKPEAARIRAKELLLIMQRDNINPNELKRQEQVKGVTLQDLHKEYQENAEARGLASGTLRNYEIFINNHFSDWKTKPIRKISEKMILSRHAYISKHAGKTTANKAMHYLRALYNFAMVEDKSLENPVYIISGRNRWHPKKQRKTVIKNHQLNPWYKAVMNLQNQTMSDALLFLLFTGLRKMEAFSLRWEDVDFNGKLFVIKKTKNDEPLELPMSDFVFKLLTRRHETRGDSPFVFPGKGKKGHITVAKKAVKLVREVTGIHFTLHDLRRTFITKAESLDISTYAVKSLVNHKVGMDVTGGYIVHDVERLRDPMHKIGDDLLLSIKKTSVNNSPT